MDGRKYKGKMDGWKNGRTEGQLPGQTDRWMDGRMDEPTLPLIDALWYQREDRIFEVGIDGIVFSKTYQRRILLGRDR